MRTSPLPLYREEAGNGKADFLSHLPVDITESDVHGSSRITHEDVDVCFVGAFVIWPHLW